MDTRGIFSSLGGLALDSVVDSITTSAKDIGVRMENEATIWKESITNWWNTKKPDEKLAHQVKYTPALDRIARRQQLRHEEMKAAKEPMNADQRAEFFQLISEVEDYLKQTKAKMIAYNASYIRLFGENIDLLTAIHDSLLYISGANNLKVLKLRAESQKFNPENTKDADYSQFLDHLTTNEEPQKKLAQRSIK